MVSPSAPMYAFARTLIVAALAVAFIIGAL